MKRIVSGLACMILITSPVAAELPENSLDVPYVPTPQGVVERMLEVANVSSTDTLFDLGCGDGRIANTAALKYGSRAFGIDIDSDRIRESRQNADGMGITDKVTFIQQDLFDTDVRSATVITLYLLRSVNLRLRPKLFRDLRPGTRIVSHDFSMNDWKPDKRIDVNDTSLGSHTIYYWIMPANVSGNWKWVVPASPQSAYCMLTIEQKFQEANGSITHGNVAVTVRGMTVEGSVLSFVTEEKSGGMTVIRAYSGTVSDDQIHGTVTIVGSDMPEFEWEAERDHTTIVPLEDFSIIE